MEAMASDGLLAISLASAREHQRMVLSRQQAVLFLLDCSLPSMKYIYLGTYTNKQMLVGVYLDPRQASDTSKSAESGNYRAFVVVNYCPLQLIQPKNKTG